MDREKKIILCDADDVIENLIDCWISAINQRYGTTVKPSEVTDWDVSLFFPTLTKEQVFDPIKEKDILEQFGTHSRLLRGLKRN